MPPPGESVAAARSGSPACELRARFEVRRARGIGALNPRVSASLEGKGVCDAIVRAFRSFLSARFGPSAMRQIPQRPRAIVPVETHEFREIGPRQLRVALDLEQILVVLVRRVIAQVRGARIDRGI